MFLQPSSSELNNYYILLEQCFSSEYVLLVVNIQIIEEVASDVRCTIIKNSQEEVEFTSDIIYNFLKIDTSDLSSKESLENTVQEVTRIQEQLWQKHSK